MENLPVASFTDAWIETRICGIVDAVPFVASFTDAWIETYMNCPSVCGTPSHLLQMRGLKPSLGRKKVRNIKSHLLQMRGLKLCCLSHYLHNQCRIFYRCVD